MHTDNRSCLKNMQLCVQGEVTENQREMIAANWGKLNLSRQGVANAKQTMIAALNAACEGGSLYQLSNRTASTNLAAEKIKAALAVSQHACLEPCNLVQIVAPLCMVCSMAQHSAALVYWAMARYAMPTDSNVPRPLFRLCTVLDWCLQTSQ